MTRFCPRAFFLAASLALAAGAPARAATLAGSVGYFLPVTYQMVVTRPGTETATATRERAKLAFETFGNRDLLRIILEDAPIKNWSLVAVGDSTEFGAAEVPFTTLKLAARHRRTGEVRLYPGTFAFELSPASATSSSEVRVAPATPESEPGELLSARSKTTHAALLAQSLPGDGEIGETIGLLSHGTVFATIKGASDLGPVLRPTAASFRATGAFDSEGETRDGMVELLITFGEPTTKVNEAEAD